MDQYGIIVENCDSTLRMNARDALCVAHCKALNVRAYSKSPLSAFLSARRKCRAAILKSLEEQTDPGEIAKLKDALDDFTDHQGDYLTQASEYVDEIPDEDE